MAHQSLAFIAAMALIGVSAADNETTIVSLNAPGYYDSVTLLGSVIKADADRTTFAVGCLARQSPDPCGIPESSWTLVQGPSTLTQDITYSEYANPYNVVTTKTLAMVTQSLGCTILNKSSSQCSYHYTGTIDGTVIKTYITYEMTLAGADHAVTITGGVEKLAATAEASKTGDKSTPTSTDSNGPAETSAATTSSDNAVAPAVTHKAFLAGVVAVIGVGAVLA